MDRWEIIDYASDDKPDVPSGTSRELAETLAQVREPLDGYLGWASVVEQYHATTKRH